MSDPIVYGFPRSTFVNIVRLVLTHKEAPTAFTTSSRKWASQSHLALHPFNRVPILQSRRFHGLRDERHCRLSRGRLSQTGAAAEERPRPGCMNQWISAVNSYYYPYMIYHVSHERNGLSRARHSLRRERSWRTPCRRSSLGLQVAERQLAHGKDYLAGFRTHAG